MNVIIIRSVLVCMVFSFWCSGCANRADTQKVPSPPGELVTVDSVTAIATFQQAEKLLKLVGLTLENVEPGIYIGNNEFVRFPSRHPAKWVLVLGEPDSLVNDYNNGIIPAFAYTEEATRPGGKPQLVMPYFTHPLVSEITFLHEYEHIKQMGSGMNDGQREQEAYEVEHRHFRNKYPKEYAQFVKKTQHLYQGKFTPALRKACEEFTASLGTTPLESWALVNSLLMMVVSQDTFLTSTQFLEKLIALKIFTEQQNDPLPKKEL